MTASSSGRSICISAGVRMWMNGFLLPCVQRKKARCQQQGDYWHGHRQDWQHFMSSAILWILPIPMLNLYCVVHTQLWIQTVFVILWKTPLSDWSILAVAKVPIVLEASAYLARLHPQKMLKVTEGIYCLTRVFTLRFNSGWIILKSNVTLDPIRLLILVD